MKLKKNRILVICIVTIFSSLILYGQNGIQNKKPTEPVLVPLTDEEKKINPKDIIENQPDFMADEAYFSAREISGFSVVSKIARKGKQFREDTGFVIVITELGKPVLKLNRDKTYSSSVADYRPFVSPTRSLNPTDLLGFKDISFTSLGTIEVDGNKLLKIEAKSKEFEEQVFLYADFNKKDLITIIQVINPNRAGIQRLQNISFDVPENLFDISEYKEMPKYKWNKIKTAKVFYEGKQINDAVAFRYNNYIFIHAGEFKHLLVDLDKKIADTVVFRGLLVSKDGYYIWSTKDEEAISIGELDGYIKPGCEYCVQIKTEPNSVTIPEPENKSKTLVKITW